MYNNLFVAQMHMPMHRPGMPRGLICYGINYVLYKKKRID